MIIVKKATQTKSAEERIQEQIEKIEKLIDAQFKRKGQNVTYYPGEARPPEKRFRDLYGDWWGASFCIEISSRH